LDDSAYMLSLEPRVSTKAGVAVYYITNGEHPLSFSIDDNALFIIAPRYLRSRHRREMAGGRTFSIPYVTPLPISLEH